MSDLKLIEWNMEWMNVAGKGQARFRADNEKPTHVSNSTIGEIRGMGGSRTVVLTRKCLTAVSSGRNIRTLQTTTQFRRRYRYRNQLRTSPPQLCAIRNYVSVDGNITAIQQKALVGW